jgi:tyrosyl-tRNA synthetase
MGIDSAHLETDVEIGGIDQLLNFQQVRKIQRSRGQAAEEIIMTPLIEGTTGNGHKMSKSEGNYIPATAEPTELFGKLMSIPDHLIMPYLKAFAPVYEADLAALHLFANDKPMEAKKQLATFVVGLSTSDLETGRQARESFESRFTRRTISEADAVRIVADESSTLIASLISTGDFKSNKELRRMAEQGGVKINGEKVTVDVLDQGIASGSIVTVGKRKVYSIVNE